MKKELDISLAIWHIINGRWVHIAQDHKGNKISYYTNGKLESTRDNDIHPVKEESPILSE